MADIVVSHGSALLLWRRLRTEGAGLSPATVDGGVGTSSVTSPHDAGPATSPGADERPRAPGPPLVAPSSTLARDLCRDFGLPLPLHVLVGSRRVGTRPTSALRCHHCTRPMSPTAFVSLGRGVAVCRPGVALRQVAPQSSFAGLALLAYELCGSYALSHTTDEGFVGGLGPACTRAELLESLDLGIWSARGRSARTVAAALACCVDGSASPRESALGVIMCASRRLGGYGLPRPLMNHPIPVGPVARGLTRRRLIVPDFLWPNGQVVEYLGAHHDDPGRAAEDSERDNALAAMGYRVLDVTRRQARDLASLDSVMAEVCTGLGIRRRPPSPEMRERHALLHAHLFLGGSAGA